MIFALKAFKKVMVDMMEEGHDLRHWCSFLNIVRRKNDKDGIEISEF